jgi:hypothetical protein
MMYSLNRKLFESKDQERDIFKKIWGLQKDCPIIIIYNNLKCIPARFLNTICPLKKPSKSLEPKDPGANLKNELVVRSQGFQALVQLHYVKVINWIVNMNSDNLKQGPKRNEGEKVYLEQLVKIILIGIDLAVLIKRATKTLLLLHEICGVNLRPELLREIVQAVEMLKSFAEVSTQCKSGSSKSPLIYGSPI